MSKYTPLRLHLQSQVTRDVPMSFADVEAVLGFRLPNSAYRHRPWWANEAKGHVHAQCWLEAGYETVQVDMAGRKLVFRRSGPPRPGVRATSRGSARSGGMYEGGRGFESEEAVTGSRHPAWGALKGTFTIAPGTDLAAPMFSDEEWREIEHEMEADWDQIAEGMSGRKA